MSDDKGFRDALRSAVQPMHKAAALTLYPDASVDAAQSKLSRVLSGELGCPWALVSVAMRGCNPGPLIAWFRAQVEPPAETRERVGLALVKIAEQMELLTSELRDADARERGVA